MDDFKVLLVDDEQGVHDATKLVIGRMKFEGRRIHLLHAHSGMDAREVLAAHPDTAVAVVDVVMETEHAGLDFVRHLREEVGNQMCRVILRTGQPGSAPEREVVRHLEIDDYKEKTELTADLLFTSIYTALRAYRTLCTLKRTSDGLERIIDAAGNVFARVGLIDFMRGTLEQLLALVRFDADGMLMHGAVAVRCDGPTLTLLVGTGEYREHEGSGADQLLPPDVLDMIVDNTSEAQLVTLENGVLPFKQPTRTTSGNPQETSMTDIPQRPLSQRRSEIFAAGDNFEMMKKAAASEVDIVHLEIEDGVVPERKPFARTEIVRALREIDFGHRESWVRVNHFDSGHCEADIDVITAGRPNAFILAKCQGPEDIVRLEALVAAAERKHGIPVGDIKLGAVIERVRALTRVEDIALSSPRMTALVFGVDDLSNEYFYRPSRIPGGELETLYARSRLVLAARAAGIDCIDAPFLKYKDLEGSAIDAQFTARLGFTGKSVLSPRQIPAVHEAYRPTEAEARWAREIQAARERAAGTGQAVFAIDGQMIDMPHFIQAERILARLAREA